MGKKKVLITVLPILAVVALGLGAYVAWKLLPPAMPETVADVETLLASERYQNMSNADKRPYQERMNEMWGELNDADKKRLGEVLRADPEAGQEAFESAMRNMYKQMFLEQDEAARTAMLDTMIDMMESSEGRRRQAEREADRDSPEGRERENEGRRRMMQWMDEGDPQAMGYGSEFFKMMQERREARGLPPL